MTQGSVVTIKCIELTKEDTVMLSHSTAYRLSRVPVTDTHTAIIDALVIGESQPA